MAFTTAQLDLLTDDSWSVKLKLASSVHPEGVWLRLPDYQDVNDGKPDEIKIALTALEAVRVDECVLMDAKCILPHAGDILTQYDSIAELIYDGNNLGFFLDERGQGMQMFMELYQAALEYEECLSLSEALDIAENLSRYERVPLSGLKDYAMDDLKKWGVKLSDTAASAFDFERYAVEETGLILSEDGLGVHRQDRSSSPADLWRRLPRHAAGSKTRKVVSENSIQEE